MSAKSKVVPEAEVVVNSNSPAPPPSEATEIALNLIGPATFVFEGTINCD